MLLLMLERDMPIDAVITADKITPENFDSARSIAELVDEILNG